jgi:CRISPR-associated protein Cas2
MHPLRCGKETWQVFENLSGLRARYKVNTQFLIVSYDIPSNRRRYKVMKTMEGFGTRVQYSVFECNLKPRQVDDLRKRLRRLIDAEDSIRLYFMSADDVKRIERLGDARTVEERIFIMQ